MGKKAAKKPHGKTSMEKPLLSLVMIAKDEEANLVRCLQSAAPWVDEIVLVDTGSTDRTPEIAREFGARVYHHAWENDFAKARNQALGYAQGAWCLQLDADEELDPESAKLLGGIIADPMAMGYRLRIDNLLPGGGVSTFHWPRLFRKHPEVHYFRKVHNQINLPGQVLDCQVRIIHHGYNLGADGMGKRHERRVSMIRRWAGDEPGNWEAWYYLTQTLVSRPESVEESLSTGAKAMELAKSLGASAEDLSRIYLPLLQGLSQLERHEELLALAGEWNNLVPSHPDPALFSARSCYALNRPEEVCPLAERAWTRYRVYAADPASCAGLQVTTGGQLPVLLVIWLIAEWESGRREKAGLVFKELIRLPNREQSLGLLMNQATERGLEELIALLHRQGAAQAAAGKADPVKLTDQAFQMAAEGKFRVAEGLYLRALKIDPSLIGAWFNLAVVLARQGKQDGCVHALRKCLEQDPGFEPARKMLSEMGITPQPDRETEANPDNRAA